MRKNLKQMQDDLKRIMEYLKHDVPNEKYRTQIAYILWIGCEAESGNHIATVFEQSKITTEVLRNAAKILKIKGWKTGSGWTGCTKLIHQTSVNENINRLLRTLEAAAKRAQGVPANLDDLDEPTIWIPGWGEK